MSATYRCSGLHVANHNQPFNGGLTMTDRNIATSQHLLKRLEEQKTSLRNLMSQVQIVASNLNGTWIAIDVTHSNWERDIEKH